MVFLFWNDHEQPTEYETWSEASQMLTKHRDEYPDARIVCNHWDIDDDVHGREVFEWFDAITNTGEV